MTDKDFNEAKKRLERFIDKWYKTLGLGWYQVDIERSRFFDEDSPQTAGKTTWLWQYRSATVTFYIPAIADLSDEKLENVVVHEFAHILTGAMVQNQPEENHQLMEYGTECVARALIWARVAGEEDAKHVRK